MSSNTARAAVCRIHNLGSKPLNLQFEPEGRELQLHPNEEATIEAHGSGNVVTLAWHDGPLGPYILIHPDVGSDYSVLYKGEVVRMPD